MTLRKHPQPVEVSCPHTLSNNCCCGLCSTRISNLGVTINKKEILKDINLQLCCGDLTAVIGPNGSGKTTLFKAMLGEIPHTGTVEFVDAAVADKGHPIIGYVPQKLDFDSSAPVTVMDLFAAAHAKTPVWFRTRRRIKDRMRRSLEHVQAEHLIDRRLGALSGGELQRVLLALALDPLPNLLFLDEPVSGIDQKGLVLFYDIVSKLRKDFDLSIILVSHDLDLVAKYADRVVFLNNKTITCCGTAEDVFRNQKVIETFGQGAYKGMESGQLIETIPLTTNREREKEKSHDRTLV
ncbi:metal ABC transporter ATP-binding protein [Dehalobacter sp. DCM]|uniref:metal ABC transporter ATP-binding protein n=1 Tax=Dehalobacter sp. DCM TaxID=2907827 RepID=UPI003081E378|nr:metal ABC transporter ATP-binding protein [Dehalobacter sp. DCM]